MSRHRNSAGRPNPELRAKRLAKLHALADEQGGVVSRRQAYALGLTRGEVRAHVRAKRWQRLGSQSVALHTVR